MRIYKLPNNQIVKEGQQFRYDNVQYPSNWISLSTDEERQNLGLTQVPPTPYYDNEYYLGYDQNGDLIPKDLNQLKEIHIQRVKQTANGNLQPTDWYVTRKLERNIDIPENVANYRVEVIAVSNQRESLISSVNSVEELKNLYLETFDSNGNTIPSPLSNWPPLM